jgi:hypothetical protein
MKEVFGFLAIIIGISGAIPYIHGIIKGTTRPHRISWGIWATLGVITLTSYIAKGAHWSALLAVAAAFNGLVIFLLSFKYGSGGATVVDRVALVLGILGVLLWLLTREAAYALLFALGADAIATILTAKKAYKLPKSESALAWTLGATASVFGLLAVQSYTFWQTIYPVYAVAGGACLALITIGRHVTASK